MTQQVEKVALKTGKSKSTVWQPKNLVRADLRRAGHDQLALRRAKISANSFLRRAKSLFAEAAIRHLEIQLPSPLPFDGVEFEERQSLKYQSEIKPGDLYHAAEKQLAAARPEVFKILLLAVTTGLRRREIDFLEWASFDWADGVIRVVPTKYDSAGFVKRWGH